jgi:hypothetical protein
MGERDLTEALMKMLVLLDSVGETFWTSKVRSVLPSLEPDEILSWYGGMGSFNDLLIATAKSPSEPRPGVSDQRPARGATSSNL